MRPVSHLADSDDAIAFAAFHAMVCPAVRDAARGPLRRARHTGRACQGTVGTDWCAECEASVDDLLLEGFTRLRIALTGPVPRTRSGEPVRELALLRAHLTDPKAREQDTAAFAAKLRGPGDDAEPRWLRAARAQLVHYPLSHLEERTRRADAVRRGASARPDRDLRSAAWAAPLRADPVDVDLLLVAVFRARRGVVDTCDVPADLRERYGLSSAEADRRMRAALARLRTVNPGFFAANIGVSHAVIGDVPAVSPNAVDDPEEQVVAATRRESARRTLHRLAGERSDAPAAGRRDAYRAVVSAVCAAGTGDGGDPVGVAVRSLGLAPVTAARLVRRLAVLIAAAGIEWTTGVTIVTTAPSPRPTNGSPRRSRGRPARGA